MYLYYGMKLVTFGIDENRNLLVQFLVFVQPYMWQQLILYHIETVPVPLVDQNKQVQSHTHFQIERPYIALNSETYISLQSQELLTCKNISYEFYCEELFMVKYKSKYSCESAIYFNYDSNIVREIATLHNILTKLI